MTRQPSPNTTNARIALARQATLSTLLALVVSVSLLLPAAAQESDIGTPPSLIGEGDANQPCFDGRLRIRDLATADDAIAATLDRVLEAGKAWEEDANLFSLRLGCPLLEVGYQLEGTFFSRTAQAFYSTGTGEIQASNEDPADVPILDTSAGIRVHFVYLSLVRAGFDENSALGAASGLTIRPSTEEQPFGPESAPEGDIYFHAAILERGEVVDVWVASRDGTVYRYTTNQGTGATFGGYQ